MLKLKEFKIFCDREDFLEFLEEETYYPRNSIICAYRFPKNKVIEDAHLGVLLIGFYVKAYSEADKDIKVLACINKDCAYA